MFITSKNKYLSNDMNIFGTCYIPLTLLYDTYKDLNIYSIFRNIQHWDISDHADNGSWDI